MVCWVCHWGGTGDTTIGFGNGDSTDRLYVKSLRYIYNNNRSYFLIGAWDDEIDLINNIEGSGWEWFNITQPTNNNPSPRTIQSTNITYRIYPVLQNGIWYVGYAFAMDVDMGGSNDLYVYRCTGNSQTKWTAIDSVVANDLENAGKFSKKTTILNSDCY